MKAYIVEVESNGIGDVVIFIVSAPNVKSAVAKLVSNSLFSGRYNTDMILSVKVVRPDEVIRV